MTATLKLRSGNTNASMEFRTQCPVQIAAMYFLVFVFIIIIIMHISLFLCLFVNAYI